MKAAQEWNWEHTIICKNNPAVSGQLLPTPQMVQFLERVQQDAREELERRLHAVSEALRDAISTFVNKSEIVVTEERVEAWKEVFDKEASC